jgi:PAS domain S-box-containing protein
MSHKTITPTGVEKPLKNEDLIVSKTDLKGRITYGNLAFASYAGYSELEFLGKPHNIVRHPDMPRSVFRLLWDQISSKKEVFAYVKNLCADGCHYWVFANVSPSFDASGQVIGYYSVRRKAQPTAIPVIEKIYRKMLDIEKQFEGQQGMNAALKWLEETLSSQNTDYESFLMSIQK